MAGIEQTKVCPLCAETIKAAAKVCPYCRKSQQRWLFLTRYDLGIIVVALLFIGTVWRFNKLFYHGRDFGLDKDKVQVVNSNFVIEKERLGTNVVVTGVLTNESGHSWYIRDFGIRYLGNKGELLGLDEPISDSFTVFPHSDHSFRLSLYSRKPIPNYATCVVQVVSAEDPKVIPWSK